jgi:hypothetical protein
MELSSRGRSDFKGESSSNTHYAEKVGMSNYKTIQTDMLHCGSDLWAVSKGKTEGSNARFLA